MEHDDDGLLKYVESYMRDTADRRLDVVRELAWDDTGIDDRLAILVLIRSYEDPDPMVRQEVVRSLQNRCVYGHVLGAFGDRGVETVVLPVIRRALSESITDVRSAAVLFLIRCAESGPPECQNISWAVPCLVSLLDDPEPVIRSDSIRAFWLLNRDQLSEGAALLEYRPFPSQRAASARRLMSPPSGLCRRQSAGRRARPRSTRARAPRAS